MTSTDYEGVRITLLAHSAFKLEYAGTIVYIDPFMIDASDVADVADVIFITHEHYDHCSLADIQKIASDKTTIVTVPGCQSKIANKVMGAIAVTNPGEAGVIGDVAYETVISYNTNKQFHSKENDWAGFIITLGGVRIYHAGDTDFIPEMSSYECDVALLPVSGTYVMTAEEAVKAAETIKPKLAIPMHYGAIVGTKSDAEKFASLAAKKGIDARILL